MVVTAPCTSAIRMEHARTAAPFMCTVQAPHSAIPQPSQSCAVVAIVGPSEEVPPQ
jgi:hypothetical protein